ncbi:MAG: ADOP family duplicated permease [Longimicrobiales bacterium]|nr:ADOP family duplicated permease [Longimicrobiales bacterium]
MNRIPFLGLAVRRLRATPGFTAAVLLTLTLALGSLVAAYAVTSAVVLEPLPYPESERLVDFGFAVPGYGFDEIPLSDATWVLVRQSERSFSDLAIYREMGGVNLGSEQPERVRATEATPDFFRVLGRAPVLGRSFTAEEARPGGPQVLVVSHGLWERRWGGDPTILGTGVVVDGARWEVIGVAPEGFRFPNEASDLWLPIQIDEANLAARSFIYSGVGRLEAGVDLAAAYDDLARVTGMAMESWPDEFTTSWVENGDFRPFVKPLHDTVVGDVSTELYLIMGTAVLLLLLSLSNLANLFVVRAERRARELALRSALGADRRELLWNLLTESAVVSAAGGALGLGLAAVLISWLRNHAPPDLPRVSGIGIGVAEVGFAVAILCAAILLFAALPMAGRRFESVADLLRAGGRSATASGRAHRIQTVLVVGQVGLAVTLLVGAGLLAQSFGRLARVDPGFTSTGAVTFELGLPRASYPAEVRTRAWSDLEGRLREVAGVEGAGAITILPLDPFFQKVPLYAEAREDEWEGSPPLAEIRRVTPGYFDAAGVDLVEGRTLTWNDGPGALRAVVVNATLARTLLAEGPATGQRIRIADDGDDLQVVGVVSDVLTVSLADPPEPEVYLPVNLTQRTDTEVPSTMQVVVRSSRPLEELVPAIREAVGAVDPGLPVAGMVRLHAIVDDDLARERFLSGTLLLMAGTGFLLAVIGVYGLIAYVVSNRQREIGIRMALGESRAGVWGGFVRRAVLHGSLGALGGLAVAGVGSRYLDSLLFETARMEPWIYGGAALVLIMTAGLAAFAPAWRAARIDPAEVLREE